MLCRSSTYHVQFRKYRRTKLSSSFWITLYYATKRYKWFILHFIKYMPHHKMSHKSYTHLSWGLYMKFIRTVHLTTTDSGTELENYVPIEHLHLPVHIDNSSRYVIEDKFWVPFVRSQVRYLHISHVPVSTSSQYRLDRATLYQVRQQALVWIITKDQFWRVLITVHSTLDYYILDVFLTVHHSVDLFQLPT